MCAVTRDVYEFFFSFSATLILAANRSEGVVYNTRIRLYRRCTHVCLALAITAPPSYTRLYICSIYLYTYICILCKKGCVNTNLFDLLRLLEILTFFVFVFFVRLIIVYIVNAAAVLYMRWVFWIIKYKSSLYRRKRAHGVDNGYIVLAVRARLLRNGRFFFLNSHSYI